MKVHILTQYIWPDGSPVCMMSEQLGEALKEKGVEVVMVGGRGKFRESTRNKPIIDLIHLPTLAMPRSKVMQILIEYISVIKHLWKYIKLNIKEEDAVIVTSAPFLTFLLRYILPKKSIKIYWLFDYFPPSVISLYKFPKFIKKYLDKLWEVELKKWTIVIKISKNLGYWGSNAVIFRQWPPINIETTEIEPQKKALYTGNLSLVHDIDDLVKECNKLRLQGYMINFYADGPGTTKLPNWINLRPTFKDNESLIKALYEHEIHLITGTYDIDDYCFPSKIWNSLAIGRKIIGCGMKGKMREEFEICLQSNFKYHKDNLRDFVLELLEKK